MFENYKNRSEDFLVQVNLLVTALKYYRFLYKEKQDLDFKNDGMPHLNFKRDEFASEFPNLLKYSRLNPPYKDVKEQPFTKEFLATPSDLLVQELVFYYLYFKASQSDCWQAEGQQNLWLVKPANNSRGNGIYLHRNRQDILCSSEGLTSRIAQKYIQRPLLLHNHPLLNNRKFDIRQWVLVSSYEPLKVYFFSQAYVRICSDTYQVGNIKTLQKHLTNYSFNKNNFANKAESVLPLRAIKDLVMTQYQVDWETVIRPKVNKLVVDTIRRCSENIDHASNCFEMYGFDILIDEIFNPWLLEVNLSPACEQRCEFLKQYCEVMGQQMLRLVLPPAVIGQQPSHLNEKYDQYRWQCLASEEAEERRREVDLQIVGVPANLKREKLLDRKYQEWMAAVSIQSIYRMIKEQRKLRNIKKGIKIAVIQPYLASIGCVVNCRRQLKAKAVDTLELYFQSIRNRRELASRYKGEYIKKIQRYLLTPLSLKKLQAKRLNAAVHTIQNIVLHMATIEKIVQRKYLISQVKKIQRFYKRRFLKKTKACRLIQKMARIYLYNKEQKRFHKQLARFGHLRTLQPFIRGMLQCGVEYPRLLRQNFAKIVTTYSRGLLHRRELRSRKAELFYASISRIQRVLRKRTRTHYFPLIKHFFLAKKAHIKKISQYLLDIKVLVRAREKTRKYYTNSLNKYLLGAVKSFQAQTKIKQKEQQRIRQLKLNEEAEIKQILKKIESQERLKKQLDQKRIPTEQLEDIRCYIAEKCEQSAKTIQTDPTRSVKLPAIHNNLSNPPLSNLGTGTVHNTKFSKYIDFISNSNKFLQMRRQKRELRREEARVSKNKYNR